MRGMGLAEAQEASMDTIDMLGLSQRIGHKPNELSGGQQQIVSAVHHIHAPDDIHERTFSGTGRTQNGKIFYLQMSRQARSM